MYAFMASPPGQAVQKMPNKATDQIITTSFPGTPSVFAAAAEPETQPAEQSK